MDEKPKRGDVWENDGRGANWPTGTKETVTRVRGRSLTFDVAGVPWPMVGTLDTLPGYGWRPVRSHLPATPAPAEGE